jgi:CHAT domain-containing protein
LRQAQLALIEAGEVRGMSRVHPVGPGKLDAAPEIADKSQQRLPPFYWAAFVLSGDWR